MPPLATLVLAEQHGGNRPPVLFPHQGSRNPENLNNSIFGRIFFTWSRCRPPRTGRAYSGCPSPCSRSPKCGNNPNTQIRKYWITQIKKYWNAQEVNLLPYVPRIHPAWSLSWRSTPQCWDRPSDELFKISTFLRDGWSIFGQVWALQTNKVSVSLPQLSIFDQVWWLQKDKS